MKKGLNLNIIILIVTVVVVILSVVLVALLTNSSYSKKINTANEELTNVQAEVSELKERKDSKGFTPTELVQSFLTEVKADSNEKAKLYVSTDLQSMDIKNTLKLGSDLANITVGEATEELNDDGYTVTVEIAVGEDTTVRQFVVSKEDGNWKIKGIIAE